jgi:predicted esterase YcpF (UPF0227 family)
MSDYGSKSFVIFIHGLNYYGAIYHQSNTQTLRDLLNKRHISNALFYKNPKDTDINDIFLSFNETIKNNKINNDLILIGHSCGGTYARYISKYNPQVKQIISLDSSYYPEYVPYVLKTKNIPINADITYSLESILVDGVERIKDINIYDELIDKNEEKNIYTTSFIVGDIGEKEIAIFYEEDEEVLPGDFRVEYLHENYLYIYLNKYHHSCHTNKNIAQFILNFIK